MFRRVLTIFGFVALFACVVRADEPQTVAEKSEYRATSRYEDVIRFIEGIEKRAGVRRAEMGRTVEGRAIPLIILADPPVATAEEARKSGKPVVFAFGNIHAGEVCGKEALLMLAREISGEAHHPLLKQLILVFAPIYNCDGNERVSKENRPGQNGPSDGMGCRENADGLDLNRDYVKLTAPETRAMVRFCNEWDPAIVIDCHTTNGSYHPYTITYAGPMSPAGDARVIDYVRDTMLPAITASLEKDSGYKSFFYGNFNDDHTRWETFASEPRYSTNYFGLRNRIAILSEAYAYAPFKDRVIATREFVRHIIAHADRNRDEIVNLLKQARADASGGRGSTRSSGGEVCIRTRPEKAENRVGVLGYVEVRRDGHTVATDESREYEVDLYNRFASRLSVEKPHAYLLPGNCTNVVENLQRHGIEVEELREDIELSVGVYRADEIKRAERAFQGHRMLTIEATGRTESRRIPAGTIYVRTQQALGNFVVCLLEPEAEDGLFTWNFFDEGLDEGQDLPVLRLEERHPLILCKTQPPAEGRAADKPITYDVMYGSGERPNFGGSPVWGLTWLEDGEHYLQIRDGRPYKVDALSGRLVPFYEPRKMARVLGKLPGLDRDDVRRATGPWPRMNKMRTGAFFDLSGDLYYASLDGAEARRLTSSPLAEELAGFSPDGRFISFVREHDLHVVDVESATERALTADGSDTIRNGQADWVYAEEIFGHGRPLHWWSPDSKQLAFIRFDDGPVHRFAVVDHMQLRQDVENTHYPKAGDPNPTVKLGIVSAVGGSVRWVDLSDYAPESTLISRVGWRPDSELVYFYVQDRAQRWLDFCTVSARGGKAKRLFRETTKAWVSENGECHFLKDHSFVIPLERSGWQHIYHFKPDGTLIKQVTDGEWEARSIHLVEESGWVYFSGTKVNVIGSDLYRVKLDGSGLERLTDGGGTHQVSVSPTGSYFIDTWSDRKTPMQVRLYRTDGELERVLDRNPVYEREEYRFAEFELLKVPMKDGFEVEAALTLPMDFSPEKTYPVWFMTYAGPHAPTIRDSWDGGRTWDQVLANMGLIVFRADPRSASGKGAVSTWNNYRQLGISELRDIEEAIDWLCQRSYVDRTRIGMAGHSYGGFMTCFALTHSKKFAAGIAGAPVTDWRLYDSIYTERFMDTPQENPDGYNATSCIKAAKDLHGRLLILHGTMDDNVHMQNTVQFVKALQDANRQFELMIYPQSRHGIYGSHYQTLIRDFIRRTLLEGPPPTSQPEAPPTMADRPRGRRSRQRQHGAN